MPRITISIPADLKQRLDDVRVRRALNVSRVCQQALWREVRRILELPLELERFEALLARLRAEREEGQERAFAQGAAAARDWVEHEASLEQLGRLGELSLSQRLARLRQEPPEPLKALLQAQRPEAVGAADSILQGWAVTLGLMWEVIRRNI